MMENKLRKILTKLYTEGDAASAFQSVLVLIKKYKNRIPLQKKTAYSERDVILITYGDMVTEKDQLPLDTLRVFLNETIGDAVNTVHILPFFPYSSDDGFSVIDYKQVDPSLGTWNHIRRLGEQYHLMVDLVANHISEKSEWFQKFKQGVNPYENFFITVPPDTDLSSVFRPRALPLLTKVDTEDGKKYVWTTFSADQVDLNYNNPQVLLAILEILLWYGSQSARYIRLDAIAYIWKQIGTDCIHLPQVHAIVQLMRLLLDECAPDVKIITETNVPHQHNIRYFGVGTNEAQMVYNFSLPPLILHTFLSENTASLSKWAAALDTPSEETTFFNFLASHDGIGITPAAGILDQSEIVRMANHVKQLGGFVSYKTNADGSLNPYELNINFLDALKEPLPAKQSTHNWVHKFITAQAMMLSLRGIPGIYFHSLFGSQGWQEGPTLTGKPRSINRQKLSRVQLLPEINDPASIRGQIFSRYAALIHQRISHPAFSPTAGQEIFFANERMFVVVRKSVKDKKKVLCLHNVSRTAITLPSTSLGFQDGFPTNRRVLFGEPCIKNQIARNTVTVPSYQTAWIAFP